MADRREAPHVARAAEFLERVRRWIAPRDDVRALVVVGSFARGDARTDSDMDVVLLTSDARRYLEDTAWVATFGTVAAVQLEEYGRVTAVRAVYAKGLEVEFAIAPADWAMAPLDPGTERVVRGGIAVILDRDGHATAVANAVGGAAAKPLAASRAAADRQNPRGHSQSECRDAQTVRKEGSCVG